MMGFFSDVFKGSGGSIVSGALGAVTGLIGNKSRDDNSWALANMNADLQREFAQNSIRWKVEDAKRAGVHPLAALGVSPASFSPVSASFSNNDSISAALADMGQNIDRAILAGKDRDAQKKAEEIADAQSVLQTRNMELQNDLLQAQIDSLKAVRNTGRVPASPPTNPKLVQDSGGVEYVPDEIISSPPDNPSVTAGTHPLWTHARSGSFVLPVLSDKIADAVTENKEKNVGAEIAYAIDAWNGKIRPPDNAFSEREHELMKSGEYEAYYYPFLGWRVEPKLSWKNFKKFVLGGYRK